MGRVQMNLTGIERGRIARWFADQAWPRWLSRMSIANREALENVPPSVSR